MKPQLARQAVFDGNLAVFGYELLIREGDQDLLAGPEGDRAGAKMIEGAVHTLGLGQFLMGRKGFVNVTRRMLEMDLAVFLPPQSSYIELLHTLEADEKVLQWVQSLKRRGYSLSVDAYTPRKGMAPLLALADIVKMDFRTSDPEDQKSCIQRYAKPNVRCLGAGIQTRQEQVRAKDLGFHLFQGSFFSKTEEVARKDIPAYKLTYLRVLQEANQTELNFEKLEALIRQDVALSFKLLRYINSAMFSLRSRVESIKQALVLLGPVVMRKWVSLLAIASMGDDRPEEVVVSALVRARFSELLGEHGSLGHSAADLFLTGMLSFMDVVLGRPMSEMVGELPLPAPMREALLGGAVGLGKVLRLVQAYEKADWGRVAQLREGMPLRDEQLAPLYEEAVEWTNQIYSVGKE